MYAIGPKLKRTVMLESFENEISNSLFAKRTLHKCVYHFIEGNSDSSVLTYKFIQMRDFQWEFVCTTI